MTRSAADSIGGLRLLADAIYREDSEEELKLIEKELDESLDSWGKEIAVEAYLKHGWMNGPSWKGCPDGKFWECFDCYILGEEFKSEAELLYWGRANSSLKHLFPPSLFN